jgi:dienelactone hydrolase
VRAQSGRSEPGSGSAGGRGRDRRSRVIAVAALVVVLGAAIALIVASSGGGKAHARGAPPASHAGATRTQKAQAPPPPAGPPFAVGLRLLALIDNTRAIHPNGTSEPRRLLTYVRYPALGGAGKIDLPNAPAARSAGPFPLVVFGHGFAVTPSIYDRLMQSWARAGYVVAAPVFPLANANAPGGPDETDLVNQPQDMSFVISSLLSADAQSSGPLAGLIDRSRIAAAGHSDGADTALAVAYNSSLRDPRVGAVVSLAGAEIPNLSGFSFWRGEPPLLAVQGTADTINPPNLTDTFYEAAQPPKFRLNLLGAEHLPPYTDEQPQLHIVAGVTREFLDYYLKHKADALTRLESIGSVAGTAEFISRP